MHCTVHLVNKKDLVDLASSTKKERLQFSLAFYSKYADVRANTITRTEMAGFVKIFFKNTRTYVHPTVLVQI